MEQLYLEQDNISFRLINMKHVIYILWINCVAEYLEKIMFIYAFIISFCLIYIIVSLFD